MSVRFNGFRTSHNWNAAVALSFKHSSVLKWLNLRVWKKQYVALVQLSAPCGGDPQAVKCLPHCETVCAHGVRLQQHGCCSSCLRCLCFSSFHPEGTFKAVDASHCFKSWILKWEDHFLSGRRAAPISAIFPALSFMKACVRSSALQPHSAVMAGTLPQSALFWWLRWEHCAYIPPLTLLMLKKITTLIFWLSLLLLRDAQKKKWSDLSSLWNGGLRKRQAKHKSRSLFFVLILLKSRRRRTWRRRGWRRQSSSLPAALYEEM